jgi:branched-chain amino acid transport system permease protein
VDIVGILQTALRSAFGPDAAVYALFAIGLNVHYGYCGLRNFGQVGFALVGAFGVGCCAATWDLPLWFGIIVGILLSVALALALGVPTLKLRADYFAITTIAAAEILRVVARSSSATDLTGGPFGLQAFAGGFLDLNPIHAGRYGTGQFSYTHTQLWSMIVTWALVAICAVFVALAMRSPWGRVVRSIREDEDVASSLGKPVFGYKLQVLVLGGVIAGLGGIMLALGNSTVNANNFQPQVTFFTYAVLIIGGAATRLGPIVGAMVFWFIFAGAQSLLEQMDKQGYLPGFLEGAEARGALATALIGVLIMAVMALRPQGLFGRRSEMALDG